MLFIGAKVEFKSQPAPIAISATATLTIAQMLAGIIVTSGAVAINLTLPTGTLSDAGVTGPSLPVNGYFDWSIINTATSSGIVTLLVGSGHTIIGAAALSITSSGSWRTRKTAANTFVTYRIG